jgi:two-component system response regulator NreC
VLEYRFKRPGGEWGKMKDTKYLLFPGNEVAIDKILCKFELMDTNEEEEMNAEEILRKNKACTRMLEFAMVHNNGQTKRSLNEQADKLTTEAPSLSSPLTKREKEILLLIGKGLSTKMIADKCSISINTVETHRRHLLEKLHVKNSMELIKEASKVFWL